MNEIERYNDIKNELKPMLDVIDIQKYLGVGRTKAYELITTGEIRSVKIGRSVKIPRKNFIEYLNSLDK